MVKTLLRLEGAAVFLLSLYFYELLGANWYVFAILLFVPDVSMIGYLRSNSFGALTYNLVHNYVLGLGVILVGTVTNNTFIASLGVILTAHVGMDRMLGLGLKYTARFRETHLQKV